MAYMKPDPTKQTSCKDCIFAAYDGNTQTGCLADRISKFENDVIAAYDDHREFYVINRLCNMFRKKTWNDGVVDIIKARSEIRVSVDILINCDNMSLDYKELIISELRKISNYTSQFSCYLYYSYESPKTTREHVFDIYNKFPKNSFVSMYFNEVEYVTGIIAKTKNSFHIKLDSKNIQEASEFVIFLDESINTELKKVILYKYKNDKIAISNMACKILYTDLYLDYDNNISKIEDDSKSSNMYIEI